MNFLKTENVLRGGGLLAGAISLLPLIASTVPAVESLHQFHEAFHLYSTYVRAPLLRSLPIDGTSVLVIDVTLLWLALFAAINAYVYKADGNFLWKHIGTNYCYRAPQEPLVQILCRLPKFAWAFLMTPVVCMMAILTSVRTGRSHLTMAYITIEPHAVAKFLVAMVAIPTIVIALSAMVVKLT